MAKPNGYDATRLKDSPGGLTNPLTAMTQQTVPTFSSYMDTGPVCCLAAFERVSWKLGKIACSSSCAAADFHSTINWKGITMETIKARKLQIVDENDEVRIEMDADTNGSSIVFYSAEAKTRFVIEETRDGHVPKLNMYDKEGNVRLSMIVGVDGGKIYLRDKNGNQTTVAEE